MGALIPKMLPLGYAGHGEPIIQGWTMKSPGTLKVDIKTDSAQFAKQLKSFGNKLTFRRSELEPRCAYCNTLHTAAVRCESCGAPR